MADTVGQLSPATTNKLIGAVIQLLQANLVKI